MGPLYKGRPSFQIVLPSPASELVGCIGHCQELVVKPRLCSAYIFPKYVNKHCLILAHYNSGFVGQVW